MSQREQLRQLPKVDALLQREDVALWMEEAPREIAVDAIRSALEQARMAILQGEEIHLDADLIVSLAAEHFTLATQRNLRRVVNATGIVLHTNLGRAKLSDTASRRSFEAATHYSTLEYDLERGERGDRHEHVSGLIARVTGAEAAIVVNNNAAATLLCLSAMAKGGEVVVSRGELVEIGGSFRIPDVMELGGAVLSEVGTTNKTHVSDYEQAIGEETAALLKVHTSNYRIVGFTEEVGLSELSRLAVRNNLPLIHDLGSGLLIDLSSIGLTEPTVGQSLREGADVVLFSGDKLLGGPQAGIIVGKKEWIDQMRLHPLARAVRADKMTLAGLEETFRLYLDPEHALHAVPTLAMITAPLQGLRYRAEEAVRQLALCGGATFTAIKAVGRVGGGCAPMWDLHSIAVAADPETMTAVELERTLRTLDPPIVARISDHRVLFDVRTLDEDELAYIVEVLLDLFG